MNLKRIFDKINFLKSDLVHKRQFYGWKSLIYTLAPYTHMDNEEKHHRILKYLEPLFLDVFRSVPNKERIQESISNDCPIWVLWWQGLESAPLIVQRCVESIKRNFGGILCICCRKTI